MKQKLIIFLQNLYNSPWPREFSAASFVVGEDLIPLRDGKELESLQEEELIGMAQAILTENEDIKTTQFYNCYIFPLYQTLNPPK